MDEGRKARMEARLERIREEMGNMTTETTERKVISSGRGDARMQRLMDLVVDEPIRVDTGEGTEPVGTSCMPTEFRFDQGEMLDWDVIIQSTLTSGKIPFDMDCPENVSPQQWALGALLNAKDATTKRRKYQVGGWEVDSDHQDMFVNSQGDEYPKLQEGVLHYFWLKIPQHGKRPRAEYAEMWARQYCRPAGVKNMINALMGFWSQGITHVRVQVLVTGFDIPDGPRVPVTLPGNIKRYFTYDNWSECQANQRMVRAAYRAMRAATADGSEPEDVSLGEYDVFDQEEITW